MSTTAYLVVNNLEGIIEESVVTVANQRNGHLESFVEIKVGDTWGTLKTAFKNSAKEKGRGSEIIKFKEGEPYWVLPHYAVTSVPLEEVEEVVVVVPEDYCFLTPSELRIFGWDVVEETILPPNI